MNSAPSSNHRSRGRFPVRWPHVLAASAASLPALFWAAALLVVPSQARATWSINLADSETREVAVGIATCVDGIDLLALAPVLVVGKGSAAAQSFPDVDGTRRATIFNGLVNATPPSEILIALESFTGHQTRQYGIADTLGRTLSFTGSASFAFAGGVIGSSGSLSYSIQGNILTGMPVITAPEQALLATSGDLPERLMAAMEAARAMGGDGRCSCPQGPAATSCGSPPSSFTSSATNGGLVVGRAGDADDPLCDASGCADGDYFMRLNVAGQSAPGVDAVIQLRALFDAFRAGLAGRPDAIRSAVRFGSGGMKISLLDWRGLPITVSVSSLTVEHAADSDGLATFGPPVDEGSGSFAVALDTTAATGRDRFVVTVDDGIRPVTLMPNPALEYVAIDIRPGSKINPINLRARGVVPVAVLGSSTFDVTDVDPASLTFGPAEATPASDPVFSDSNADGFTDLVAHFGVAETGLGMGDTRASLSGTIGGRRFRGTDSVRIQAPRGP